MAYCVYFAVDPGSVTRFFSIARAQPVDVPVMYLRLVATGEPAPPAPPVTLSLGASAPSAIPYQGRATLQSGNLAVEVAYDAGDSSPSAGESRFQLRFFLIAGDLDALRTATWSLQVDGSAGQSFAWVIADSADDAHGVVLPYLAARSAAVTGTVTSAALNVANGTCTVGSQPLVIAPTGFTVTLRGAAFVLSAAGHGLKSGDGPLRVGNSGGALPLGLQANRDYWAIRVTDAVFKLATSFAGALAGTSAAIAGFGTGTHTIASTASTMRPAISLLSLGVAGDASVAGSLTVAERLTANVAIATQRAEVQMLDVPPMSTAGFQVAPAMPFLFADNRDNALYLRSTSGVNVSLSRHIGFSYHTNGFVKKLGWNPVVVDVLDYDAFGNGSYDIHTGVFTAPFAGYYRFTMYGYSPTHTSSTDARVSAGLALNEQGIVATAGGQLSQVDTPLPSLSHVMHLRAGDKVTPWYFSTIDISVGGGTSGINAFFFQGEYLGE